MIEFAGVLVNSLYSYKYKNDLANVCYCHYWSVCYSMNSESKLFKILQRLKNNTTYVDSFSPPFCIIVICIKAFYFLPAKWIYMMHVCVLWYSLCILLIWYYMTYLHILFCRQRLVAKCQNFLIRWVIVY